MCGIFGIIIRKDCAISSFEKKSTFETLLTQSESRGKEASGFVLALPNELVLYKEPIAGSVMLQSDKAKEILGHVWSEPSLAMIGHARLVTNGSLEDNLNNQPVQTAHSIGIHNGIIVNDKELWEKHPDLLRKTEVDTEVVLALIDKKRKTVDIPTAVSSAYEEIYGTASLAVFFDDVNELLLCTNNGSLYYAANSTLGYFLFSSEARILREALKSTSFADAKIEHLGVNMGALVNLDTCVPRLFSFKSGTLNTTHSELRRITDRSEYKKANLQIMNVHPDRDEKKLLALHRDTFAHTEYLKRCTQCILPETFPLIAFDEKGLCNFCRFYVPIQYKDRSLLVEAIQKGNRGTLGRLSDADCLMGYSGGRDSCYGLHYLVRELGIRPIAYTYDWGVITDLGRRNQSRLCAKLGIEHIIVSADIRTKRANIRKNINAWLAQPDLGMVPLFMAGDKQYFYYLNQLGRDMGIDEMIMCESPLERTHFKQGFCGVEITDTSVAPYASQNKDKLKIANYYVKSFLSNPAYLNSSLLDTFMGYMSYYFTPHSWKNLFDYVQWEEEKINKVLIEEYDWELAPDTKTTWRIGDGTTPFYNLIYFVGAGFTENDALRSNQVREGVLTRTEALDLAQRDNMPRFESMKWYFETIGVDMGMALKRIGEMGKLYGDQIKLPK